MKGEPQRKAAAAIARASAGSRSRSPPGDRQTASAIAGRNSTALYFVDIASPARIAPITSRRRPPR